MAGVNPPMLFLEKRRKRGGWVRHSLQEVLDIDSLILSIRRKRGVGVFPTSVIIDLPFVNWFSVVPAKLLILPANDAVVRVEQSVI